MALIKTMPSLAVVKSLRGTLDFYKWYNLNIVRKWPRKPDTIRSDYSLAASGRFTYITQQAGVVDPEIKPSYDLLADASKWTWKDFEISLWLKGTTRVSFIPKETA